MTTLASGRPIVVALIGLVVLGCGGITPAPTTRPDPPLPSTCSIPPLPCGSTLPAPTATGTSLTPSPGPTVTPTPTPYVTRGAGCAHARPPVIWDGGPFGCTGPMVLDLPTPGTLLDPGLYQNRAFQPRIWFEVGDGWIAEQQTAGFFDIQDKPGSPDVVAVQFANVASATLDGAVEELTSQPNTRVLEQDASTIGGLTGVVLVIETTDPPDTDPPLFRPVLTTVAGPIAIASGRRLWVSLLPVENGVLAVMVGGSIAHWDRALTVAEPVLESVRILE